MMNTDVDEPIEVVTYDPAWPRLFDNEAGRLLVGISEKVNCMEHFGSRIGIGSNPKSKIVPSPPSSGDGHGEGRLDF